MGLLSGFGPQRAALIVQGATGIFIEFDASLSETHTFTSEATEHPVEKGSDFTDHIKVLPDELAVEVIVTNDPPLVLASFRAPVVFGFGNRDTRAEDSAEFLRVLQANKTIVQFESTLRVMFDSYIKSISVSRNADTGAAVRIQLLLKEIQVATTETSLAPTRINSRDSQKTSAGHQAAIEPSEVEKAEAKGLLLRGFNAVGRIAGSK